MKTQDKEKLQERIRQCDEHIIEALNQRMKLTRQLTDFDIKHHQPLLGPGTYQDKIMKKSQDDSMDEEADGELYGELNGDLGGQIDRLLRGCADESIIRNIYQTIIESADKVRAQSLFSCNILLVGFMGTGKSTISSYLVKTLGVEEADTDRLIEQREGRSIANIFETDGEAYFRRCETQLLAELQRRKNLIISCGGGMVLQDENVRLMKENGKIVLLTARPETIYERVKDSRERPILNHNMNVEFIAGLLEKRRPKYLKAADIIIATDGRDVPDICEELIEKVAGSAK